MNNKGSANIILIILVVVLAGALTYVTLVKKPTTEQLLPTNVSDIQEILSNLVNNWKSIGVSILPGFPNSNQTFYGYPDIIQFIGYNAVIVSYKDDPNALFAVLRYNVGQQKFSYLDGHGSPDFKLTETLWNTWRSKYGDVSFVPQTYKFSSTKTGDAAHPSDWKQITGENPFTSN